MRAEIISCGTELLLGHISDTNATFLAQSLASLGVDLYHVSQVGDNQERVVETLRRALERSDLVVMTGGVGPTEDDLTRESISALVGEEMRVDPVLEQELRARFSGRDMPERNLKQATLIPSAQTLPNPRGSAPGWFVQKDQKIIVAMPGVPREMYRMWEEEAVPRLAPYLGGTIFTRILRVYGLGESTVEERLGELIHSSNPTVATYAKPDAVDVRISAKSATSEEAEKLVSEAEVQAREILGALIFGTDKDTLASVTGSLLQARHQTLSVMESLTGGLLASTITDFKTSSSHFIGGIISYSTDLKAQFGVPRETIERYGVVSEETAIAMAKAVRMEIGTDFGISVTGVAGPDELDGKPAGTMHIAVAGPNGVVTGMGPGWRSSRSDNKRHAVNTALNLLRLYLEGRVEPK
ncbi:putative competence-damage inducible protein [Ktedonobacter sp. SOSP1-85]|uniref:competence/damage-inducible protein A n=1 Tax=Ktedonobacter sp. SOSP1-85 TaxID=2778367 RepID=UPI0019157D61|nr:competence/damage-inducible protein A [Ktedonobacter sp. SOSP1-85]GHO77078.1 putative competence-damage inducible protein [Ktedonobacter sp. SOSP1-85]